MCTFAALFSSVTLQTAVSMWYSQHETQTPSWHDMQYRAEQCRTHAYSTPILKHYQSTNQKNVEMLDRVRQPTPTSCPPPQTDGQIPKGRQSSQTQTGRGVTRKTPGNKHATAVGPRCVSKKIWGNIKERHVCANLRSFHYSAEIIIFAHQTLKLEWRKTSKEMILRPDVWNHIFG